MKLFYAYASLVFLIWFMPKNQESGIAEQSKPSTEDSSLSSQEWKRFEFFSKQLDSATSTQNQKESKLKAYTRDSLKVLEVKLMAIKVLDERKLLAFDISENTAYYEALLVDFQESAIAPMDYLFFERYMNAYIQEDYQRKTRKSNWVIFILGGFCLFFGALLLQKRGLRKTPLPTLSKQEHIVKNLMLQGKTNKEIAKELFISLSTVKTHITNIYSKLQVTSRTELFQKGTGTST